MLLGSNVPYSGTERYLMNSWHQKTRRTIRLSSHIDIFVEKIFQFFFWRAGSKVIFRFNEVKSTEKFFLWHLDSQKCLVLWGPPSQVAAFHTIFPGKIFCLKRPQLSETEKIRAITPGSWYRGFRLWRGFVSELWISNVLSKMNYISTGNVRPAIWKKQRELRTNADPLSHSLYIFR